MKQWKWYGYIFEDNTYVIARGLSAHELKVEERKHGKLISKEYLYTA